MLPHKSRGLISVNSTNWIACRDETTTTSHDGVCSEELNSLCLRRDIRFFHKFHLLSFNVSKFHAYGCFNVPRVLKQAAQPRETITLFNSLDYKRTPCALYISPPRMMMSCPLTIALTALSAGAVMFSKPVASFSPCTLIPM